MKTYKTSNRIQPTQEFVRMAITKSREKIKKEWSISCLAWFYLKLLYFEVASCVGALIQNVGAPYYTKRVRMSSLNVPWLFLNTQSKGLLEAYDKAYSSTKLFLLTNDIFHIYSNISSIPPHCPPANPLIMSSTYPLQAVSITQWKHSSLPTAVMAATRGSFSSSV